ncbi:MAG: aspartate ammonia-lyase [Eubacterium sp.]|nr:aspartate ammonia-lyase [Candidatus Colimonas fimequi]
MSDYRVEKDFLGEIKIPQETWYGIQTIRGVGASQATGNTFSSHGMELIKAIAQIKIAEARTNCQLGALSEKMAKAIEDAGLEILRGEHDDMFPVDILTGGGGISIHMNVNEVIANRATAILGEKVHPNTHVNMGQSTNDVLPAAMLIMVNRMLNDLADEADETAKVIAEKSQELADVVKLGRTCLQDAVPMSLGQQIGGWAANVSRQAQVCREAAAECLQLPLGATAIGTGSGTHAGYEEIVFEELSQITGLKVSQCDDLFDGLQNADHYLRFSAAFKSLAAAYSKISRDLRFMSSGPRGGIGEITIPSVLPGSSIMPGKINPTVPELMIQIYFIVAGNDVAVSMAAEQGELELNVWEAVMIKSFLENYRMLKTSVGLFRDCVAGIKANEDECLRQAENSIALAAIVSAKLGYEVGSQVAHKAIDDNMSVKEAAVALGILTKDEADELLDVKKLY